MQAAQDRAARIIQRAARMLLARQTLSRLRTARTDQLLAAATCATPLIRAAPTCRSDPQAGLALLRAVQAVARERPRRAEHVAAICAAAHSNITAGQSFIDLVAVPAHTAAWVGACKELLRLCVDALRVVTGNSAVAGALHVLLVLTEPRQWRACQDSGAARLPVMTALLNAALTALANDSLFPALGVRGACGSCCD